MCVPTVAADEGLGEQLADEEESICLLAKLAFDLLEDVVLEAHQVVGDHAVEVFLVLFVNHIEDCPHLILFFFFFLLVVEAERAAPMRETKGRERILLDFGSSDEARNGELELGLVLLGLPLESLLLD